MAKGLCPPFDAQAYREGHLTPVLEMRVQGSRGSHCHQANTNRRPMIPRRAVRKLG
jgi:hypothetical protein